MVLFPTTTVGSFPKPDYLQKARSQFVRGKLKKQDLERLERKATQEVIAMQNELDLDILVDGELYRGDMAAYFADHLEGCVQSGLVRSYGNRYYKKPIVKGKIVRKKPITLDWYQFSQSLTHKPVKGMLTGPYTLMDWSFNEYYPSREACAMAFAEAIRQEAEDLQKSGATYIQIDEPAVSVRIDELDLAIRALGHVTKNLKVKTITHICYGEFDKIYPGMLKLPVDMIDLELANGNYELLNLFKNKKFTKEIGLGVLDVHTHRIETINQVADGIRRATRMIDPKNVCVDPDCGLKTRTMDETYKKLKVMVAGVKKVRKEFENS